MEPHTNETPPELAIYVPGRTTAWNNRWRDFYELFAQAILAYAKRSGLNDHSAEDALQEVMTTLIRCQHGQEPAWDRQAGSFQAWLWGVIRNRVRSVRRKDAREEPTTPLRALDTTERPRAAMPGPIQPPPDFAGSDEERWQQALLAAALRKVQQRVTPENFAVYQALLEERATPEELGLTYSKPANAIYAVKHRCDKMLVAEAKRFRAEWEQLRLVPVRSTTS
jgi:RNA polymerase sigma factor (sigma-70 family)